MWFVQQKSLIGFCSDIIDDKFIMDCNYEKCVDELINKIYTNKPDKERQNILLSLDDVFSDDNFHQSPSL